MKPARIPSRQERPEIAKANELIRNETFYALVSNGLQASIDYQERRIQEEEREGGAYTGELSYDLELTKILLKMVNEGITPYKSTRRTNRRGHPVLYINCAKAQEVSLGAGKKTEGVNLSIQITGPDQPQEIEESSIYYRETPERIALRRWVGGKISIRLSHQTIEETEEGRKFISGPGIVITLDNHNTLEIQRLRRFGGDTYIIPREDSEPLIEGKLDDASAKQLRELIQRLL